MKVINRLGSKNLYFGSAILALLTFSILAPALASVIVTTQTTIVTGPCVLIATLQDGSPNGLTTTTTNTCTNTFTYPSTTTTTTTISTTGGNREVIYHVNGGPGCPVLGIVADVNSFRGNFSVTNGNGLSMWKINFNMSDLSDNLLVVLSFSAINQNYTVSQLIYQNGVLQNASGQSRVIPVEYHGPITSGMDIDFFTDGDGGQAFLYAPGQSQILFGHNFPVFLPGVGVPFVAFNDMATNTGPVNSDGTLTFSHLNLNQQVGQQYEQPQPKANIPVFVVNPMVTPDPCSLQPPTNGPNTNAIQSVIGPKNNDTLIELEMKSP